MSIHVIDDPAAAVAALDPVRARILAALFEPGSAASVAGEVGLTRQKVNYHLRALEDQGLVRFVEERPRRGLTERVVVASASGFVLDPALLGENAASADSHDRLSAQYLMATASRIVADVAGLLRRASRVDKTVATLTIDTDIRFASAGDRAEFTAELTDTVRRLAARYHDETSPRGRWHRLIVAAHPHANPQGEPRD